MATRPVRNGGEADRGGRCLSRGNAGRQDRDFRERRPQTAVVRRGPPNVEPTLQHDAAPRPRVDRQIEAVPVLDHVPVAVGKRRVVVDVPDVAGLVVESGDRLAAQGQARIDRRGDAVAGVVVRSHRAVVHDREVTKPAAEIAEVHGKARHDFLLDAHGEFLVPRPVAPSSVRRRVDGRAAELTEERVVGAPQSPLAAGLFRLHCGM